MAIEYARRRFTVNEYHKMGDAGILDEDDRVELIDGEIVHMSPINVPHAACVDSLTMLLARQAPEGVIVRVQSPILIDDLNEPQPDLSVLKPGNYRQAAEHPGPDDILLLIEVADSTVRSDRLRKIPYYARAGIREVWLVNLPKSLVEVYSDPVGGKYQSVKRVGHGEALAPQALPGVTLPVRDFLGQAS